MNKMNNESDRVNSPPLISKVDEQLKEIQRIREINNNNIIEIHKILKLEKELEEYEEEIKLKQLQLNRVIDQNNRQKSSIQQKHEVVQKLAKEIEKRDKILELCHNHGNNGGENSEVFLDHSNGHRTFEFRNRQKKPFTIKTERLSPVSFLEKTETGIETEIGSHYEEPEFEEEIVQNAEEEKVAEEKRSNENSLTKELLQNEFEFEELPIHKEEEEAKEVENCQVFEKPQQEKEKNEDENPHQQEIILQQQKTIEEYDQYYQQYQAHYYAFYYAQQQQQQLLYQQQLQKYYQTLPQEQQQENLRSCPGENSNDNEMASSSFKTLGVFSSSSENVMNIPEIFRSNFGTSECPELAKNPMALQFWFDPVNSHMTKFFIKLHGNGSDNTWKEHKSFVVIEQLGLNIPTTHVFKHKELLEKLEKTPEDLRKIWLDVRCFNFMFHFPHSVLPQKILTRVTHLSFGKRTEEKNSLDSHLLLEFLLNHLDNLEFCCINNSQLWSKSFRRPNLQSGREEMKNLKTLIFVHEFRNFPDNFIASILKLSPNLMNIFNLPLHHVQEMNKTVKSLYFRRDLYNTKDTGTITFVDHLSFLHGLSQWNQWNFLQELDCRTFFLNCESSSLDICCQWLSQILMMHAQSLKIIKLQATSSTSLVLPQTTMENLTTLQFHLTRNFDTLLLSFFPLGFYHTLFPKLTTVEIILECKGKSIFSPPAILFWKHFPSTIFYPGASFNSVTSLKLHGFNVVECMRSIAELFPNILVLQLEDNLKHVCAVLPSCYGFWPGLKQLHLNVNSDTRIRNLDAPLLGTSEEICSNLRKENQQVQEEEIQKIASSSICQLKELELLKIVLRPAENQQDGNGLPMITQVGARVLSLCNSQLKVQIAFDESVDAEEKTRIVSSLSPLQSFSSPFLPIL